MSAKDINYLSYADQSGLLVRDFDVRPDKSVPFADSLKLSHCTDSSFIGGVVYGANENSIDLNNRCEAILVENVSLHGGDQAAIVVKGGSTQIHFKDILIFPSYKSWCDVLWDDWSDQSRAPSTGILENIFRDDRRPVRVVFGRFCRPSIVGGNVRILWAHTIGLHAYNLAKGLYVSTCAWFTATFSKTNSAAK